MNRIEDIKSRLDLYTEVVNVIGPPAKITGGIASWRCPKHDERTPSFVVNLAGQHQGKWRCWGACGVGGDVLDFHSWMGDTDLARTIERLSGASASYVVAPRKPRPPRQTPVEMPPARRLRVMPTLDGFLHSRHWDVDVAQRVGLEVVGDWRGNPRVRFPFLRSKKDSGPVFCQDRIIGDAQPKWLSPRGSCPCPFEAWRMSYARQRRSVFIVEGLPDVVALLHYWPDAAVIGIPGATAFKSSWARCFRGLTEIVVVADNDRAGERLRSTVEEVLEPVTWKEDIHHLYIPERHKDIDAWRQADPDAFPDEFLAALERTHRGSDGRGRDQLGRTVGGAQAEEGEEATSARAHSGGRAVQNGDPPADVDRAGDAAGGADPVCRAPQDGQELADAEPGGSHHASDASARQLPRRAG